MSCSSVLLPSKHLILLSCGATADPSTKGYLSFPLQSKENLGTRDNFLNFKATLLRKAFLNPYSEFWVKSVSLLQIILYIILHVHVPTSLSLQVMTQIPRCVLKLDKCKQHIAGVGGVWNFRQVRWWTSQDWPAFPLDSDPFYKETTFQPVGFLY